MVGNLRDTPDALKAYLQSFNPGNSPAQIAAAAQFEATYAKNEGENG